MAIQCFAPTVGEVAYLVAYPTTGLVNARSAQTLSVWFNVASWPTVTWSMFGFYNGTANLSTAPTTAVQIGTRNGTVMDVWTWGGGVMISSTGFTLPTNTWFHVAYTCNTFGTNQTHQLYINGVLNNTTTNTIQINGVLTQIYINGYPEGSRTAETGAWLMDDARCFDRQLTADEIRTIASVRGSSDGICSGSVCRYDFSEGYLGTSVGGGVNGAVGAVDLSSQLNNLTLVRTTASPAPIYVADYSDRYERPTHS